MSLDETVGRLLKGEGLKVTELLLLNRRSRSRKNTRFAVCAANFTWKMSYEIILPNNDSVFPANRELISELYAGIRYRRIPWFSELQPVDLPCDVVCQRLLLAFTSSDTNNESGDEERRCLLLSNDSQLSVAASVEAKTRAFTAKKLVKYCMPSIYEQLSVNTCGILGVQHNGRIPGQTDRVFLNTLVLLEYKEEEEELSLSSPPKPEDDGFRWHDVTNQKGSVLPVQSL
uniref:Uncharacterized protein n=1 Tax=Sinocyclocheilus grahami TaxID=75366 RepID=A0A672LA95_SINGR